MQFLGKSKKQLGNIHQLFSNKLPESSNLNWINMLMCGTVFCTDDYFYDENGSLRFYIRRCLDET